MVTCSKRQMTALRWLFTILLLIACMFFVISIATRYWFEIDANNTKGSGTGQTKIEIGLWEICTVKTGACKDIADSNYKRFVEEAAGPLIILAAIFTFFAIICSFALILKYRQTIVYILFVLCVAFAVIFAWIGIGIFVNPVTSSAEYDVNGAVIARWSLILCIVAALLLTLLLIPIVCVAIFCGVSLSEGGIHIKGAGKADVEAGGKAKVGGKVNAGVEVGVDVGEKRVIGYIMELKYMD